ncbi:MAG: PAS domain-containing sensor histidine kinase, partial [Ginsengibacter sp.]
ANKELVFQNKEKVKRAAELIIANKELVFQNKEKVKRAAELFIANKELAFQNQEKEKRAAELIIANKELAFQNEEKEKRAKELIIINRKLSWQSEHLETGVLSNKIKHSFRQKLKRPSFRELLIIGLITVVLIILGLTVDWTEALVNFLYRYQDTPLDDIFVSISALSYFLIIYIIRRNNEKIKLIRVKEKAEAALRESERILAELGGFNQKLIDVSSMGIGSYDEVSGKCLSANPALAKILGGSNEEILKQNFRQLKSWKETSLLRDAEDTLLNGKVNSNEILISTSFNTEVWIDYRFIKFFSKHQPHLLLMVNDISVRKKAEQLLLSSQASLKAIIENSDASIYSLDRDFRYITFNHLLQNSMKQIYGLDIKRGDNVYDFLEKLNPEEAREWQAVYSKALEGENVKFEKEFNFNNMYSCISFSIHPIWEHQHVIGLSCFTLDITKQKQAEAIHKQSELRYREFFETAPEVIVVIDTQTRNFVDYNNNALKFLKCTGEELLQKSPPDVSSPLQPDGKTAIEKAGEMIQLALQSENPIFEWVVRDSEGKDTFCEVRLTLLTNYDHQLIRCSVIDITKRKEEDEKLLQSEFRYRQIVETAQEGIWLVNEYNKTNFVNKKMCEILEYSFEEMMDKENIYFMDDAGKNSASVSVESRNKRIEENADQRYITKSGKHIWTNVSANPVLDKNGNYKGALRMVTNITEKKKLEEERLKMTAEIIQRNKDLEQFSYIISHNLRAPVANILGLSSMLQRDNLEDNLKNEINCGLSASVNKLDEVIRDLNNILKVRQEVNENKQLVIFSALANDIRLSIESMIVNEKASIVCDFSEVDEMLTIKSYLYSIFYNLISNSLKYKQPGISPVIEIKSKKLNDKIILFFKDNGLGIDLQKRGNQVFGLYKRFHTDHAEGKGMGLYMVKTQVESIGGKISITSEINKGTEFKIEFETKQS